LNSLITENTKTAGKAERWRDIMLEEKGVEMEAAAAEMWHRSLKRGILLILQKLFEAGLIPYPVCP